MKNVPIYLKKIQSLMINKKRAISPVIATVLLIGLVVIAGLGVAIVIFGTVNTPAPLKVEVVGISSFETTDDDYLVDRFEITIENTERTSLRITRDSFRVFYFNRTEILGWSLDISFDEIPLRPFEISDGLFLECDNTDDQNELTPTNTTIYIDVTVYPEGNDDPRSAKTFSSDLLVIGETYGPVSLVTTIPSSTFGREGLFMNLTVANSGSLDLNLILEFSTGSFGQFFFTINGENSTTHSFTLDGFSSTNFPTDVFQMNSTVNAVPDDHIVFVTLLDNDNQKVFAIHVLVVTYEP